ncbi:MAG: hypothetical protein ACTHMV_16020 [Chitinophagaceae bacterium]
MYELTKQKSKGRVILFGIIIFTFISAVLKMAFYRSPTTLNDDLIKAANEINSHAPVILDSSTRFDYVNALHGNTFQYNYTLTKVDAALFDTTGLMGNAKQSMLEEIRRNPNISFFADNNIEIQARYTDRKGKEVCIVTIPAAEYKSGRK